MVRINNKNVSKRTIKKNTRRGKEDKGDPD